MLHLLLLRNSIRRCTFSRPKELAYDICIINSHICRMYVQNGHVGTDVRALHELSPSPLPGFSMRSTWTASGSYGPAGSFLGSLHPTGCSSAYDHEGLKVCRYLHRDFRLFHEPCQIVQPMLQDITVTDRRVFSSTARTSLQGFAHFDIQSHRFITSHLPDHLKPFYKMITSTQ